MSRTTGRSGGEAAEASHGLEPATVLAARREVRHRPLDDDLVVLQQARGEVMTLSPVGRRVVELADGERPLTVIVDELLAELEVDRPTLERDVLRFAAELVAAEVLEVKR